MVRRDEELTTKAHEKTKRTSDLRGRTTASLGSGQRVIRDSLTTKNTKFRTKVSEGDLAAFAAIANTFVSFAVRSSLFEINRDEDLATKRHKAAMLSAVKQLLIVQ